MWADRRTDEQHQYRENTSEELPSQGEYVRGITQSGRIRQRNYQIKENSSEEFPSQGEYFRGITQSGRILQLTR